MKRLRTRFVLLSCLLLTAQTGAQTSVQGIDSPRPSDIPVRDFARLPNYQGIEISPSGRHIAYLITVADRAVIAIHPLNDTSQPVIIPPFANAEISWFSWANDNMLAVSFSYSGNRRVFNGQQLLGGRDTEETRFMGFHRDGSNLRDPVHLAIPEVRSGSRNLRNRYESEPLVQDQVIHWLPEDPEHLLLNIDSDLDGRSEVRLVDVNTGKFRLVLQGIHGVQRWLADGNGIVRYGFGSLNGERKGYFRESEDSPFREISDSDWFQRELQPVAFDTADPRVVYAVGKAEQEHDTQSVLRLDVATGEILEVLHHDPRLDTLPLIRFRNGDFLGYRVDNRSTYLDRERAALQATLRQTFDGQIANIVTGSPDWRRLIIAVRSDVEAGALYFWDRDRGEMTYFGAMYPELLPTLMAPMQEIRYRASDGLEIQAFLTLPRDRGSRDLPLVIMPHGGPFAAQGWGFDFMTQMMASRGYAVLQPNFRGSLLQGEAFREAGKKQWGGKMQDDLSDGVAHLVRSGIADPERVCIVGWSYGGYAALMGTIKTPELYRCAVSINGVSDLQRLASRYGFDRDYRQFIREYIGLEGSSLEDVSPLANADKIEAPVLLVHAADDHRVPVEHADDMAEKLKRHSKSVRYERISFGGGHSLLNGSARLQMMTALERFLRDHLEAG